MLINCVLYFLNFWSWFYAINLCFCHLYNILYKILELSLTYTVSQKNIPIIFDCNLKKNYRILIIFGTNIPDTTCHQMTI